ncbi:MAG TPA: hypothetical protein VNG29_01610 [Candidatus Paceibacterota bacterium]|nr:hypothetical protein [Candidatus Paceibacterota bacterium]
MQMDTPNQKAQKQQNTAMAVLAYIGPLVIVSYLVAKDDPFVKFHIKQGLVLFAASVVVWILGTVAPFLWILLNLVNLAIFVLAVLGIINVIHGKEEKLPVVGAYARHFTF